MPKSVCLALLILFGFSASLLPSSAQGPSEPASASPSVTKLPVGPAISERVCARPTPGRLQCAALRLKQRPREMALASGAVDPQFTPSGFGPADLLSAYNLTSVSALNGAGFTVAIVDAQDDPNAESDMGVYRSTFGLPPCTTANGCFAKVNGKGQTGELPSADAAWAEEISLDLDMVSAICPNCNILLVEAEDAANPALYQAEDTAFQLGAKAISNSYGGPESSSDPSDCLNHFNHPGVAISAASGDEGFEVEFPAACGFVTAVGGTSLFQASNARGWGEVVWSTSSDEGTGSGCSTVEAKPVWQTDTGCSNRTVADVSAVADPSTGVAVYDTFDNGGWLVFGGTSVAAPLIAGVYGLAQPALDSDVPAMYAYANTNAFYDVTFGQTANCGSYLCTAEVGYDGPTGVGTPNGVGGFEPATPDHFSIADNPNSLTLVQGTSGSSQISTAVSSGNAETVTLSVRGLPSGATASFSPSSISSGQSATLNINAGTAAPNIYSLTIIGTALSGSNSAGLGLTITSPATATNVGSSLNPSTYGQPVTFTAIVTGIGTPIGTVQFAIDGVNLGPPVTLVSASATSSSTSTLTATTTSGHVVTAAYTPGSSSFAASNGTLSGGQIVNQATPTITWSAPTPVTYGTALSPAQLDATASVAGVFVYTPAAGAILTAGTQTLSAAFTPNDTIDYKPVAVAIPLTVNRASTTTSLTVTTSQTITGTTATVVATVKPQISGTPTGTLTYILGTSTLGSAAVGTTFTTANLPVGADKLTAVYSGDSNFLTSSGTVSVTGVAPTPVRLTLLKTTVDYPFPAIGIVSIPVQTFKPLSGTLTLYDGTTAISSVPMPATGILEVVTSTRLAIGTHKLIAVFSGNAQYPPGHSEVVTLTVVKSYPGLSDGLN